MMEMYQSNGVVENVLETSRVLRALTARFCRYSNFCSGRSRRNCSSSRCAMAAAVWCALSPYLVRSSTWTGSGTLGAVVSYLAAASAAAACLAAYTAPYSWLVVPARTPNPGAAPAKSMPRVWEHGRAESESESSRCGSAWGPDCAWCGRIPHLLVLRGRDSLPYLYRKGVAQARTHYGSSVVVAQVARQHTPH